MRPGPAPQPTSLRILSGNPGKRKLNRSEARPRPLEPEKPNWLDRQAGAEWDKLAPMLFNLGLLTEADGDALAAYCQALAMLAKATRAVNRKGLTLVTPTGQVRTRPEVIIQQRALVIVRGYAEVFGLTPSSRSRIEIPEDGTEDDLPGGIR
jgi:P27 family predicted phage terminase small subunit